MLRKRLAIFGLYFLLLTFISCSKFSRIEKRTDGFSSVEITSLPPRDNSGIGTNATLNGSVLVYVVGENPGLPKKTINLTNESGAGSISLNLPNGPYKFFALGYSQASLKGQLYCAKANGGNTINLDGSSTNIALYLTGANCNSSYFSGDTAFHSSDLFNPLKILSCSNSFAVNSATGSSVCTSSKGNIHLGRSVKLLLLGYDSSSGTVSAGNVDEGKSISSDCIRGVGNPGASNATGVNTSSGYQGVVVHNSNTIIFGGQSGEMLLSTDAGVSYSYTNNTYDNRSMASDGTTLVRATTTGVFISTDAGATYVQRESGVSFWGIDVKGTKIAAGEHGTNSGNVYISTNSGASFSSSNNGNASNIEAIYIDSATGDVYAAGGGQVKKTTNNGSSWTTFATGFNTIGWFEIIGNYVFVSDGLGLHISTDGGTTYTDYCNTGCTNTGKLPNNAATDVLMVGKTLYVGTAGGIGFAPNIDDLSTFSSANLIGSGSVYQMAYSDGTIYYSNYGQTSGAKKTDGLGNGSAFPATAVHILPLGDSSSVKPFAVRAKVYDDANCTTFKRNHDFLNGLYRVNGASNNAPYIDSGSAYSKLFLLEP